MRTCSRDVNVDAADLVVAEDDPDDTFMILRALSRCRADLRPHTVRDGVALMAYLRECLGAGCALPALVLLDLNMPRMDGREVLVAMKADSRLRELPVVVLTTSIENEERVRSQSLGAADYVTKPDSFGLLVDVMQRLTQNWFSATRVIALPVAAL